MELVNEERDVGASFAGGVINGHALGKSLRSQFQFRYISFGFFTIVYMVVCFV